MAIALDHVLLLAAGGAMLALAAFVLAIGATRGLNRAFAALLAARGVTIILPQLSTDPQWLWTAYTVQPYFSMALPVLAAYCLWTWPRAGAAPRGPAGGWWTVGALATVWIAYALNHALLHTMAVGEAANGAMRAGPGLMYTSFGPLVVVVGAGPLLMAILGLWVAGRYRIEADTPAAPTNLLVACGFMLGALFDGSNRLSALVTMLDGSEGFPWGPWGWAILVLPIAALVPGVLTLLLVAAGRALLPRPLHVLEGRLLAVGLIAFFSGFLRLAIATDPDVAGHPVTLVLLGFWRLMMPALVAYGLALAAWQARDARVAHPGPAPDSARHA